MQLAQDIQAYLRVQMPLWRDRYPGVENMHVAVMGCVVNGPGECEGADIAIFAGDQENLDVLDFELDIDNFPCPQCDGDGTITFDMLPVAEVMEPTTAHERYNQPSNEDVTRIESGIKHLLEVGGIA